MDETRTYSQEELANLYLNSDYYKSAVDMAVRISRTLDKNSVGFQTTSATGTDQKKIIGQLDTVLAMLIASEINTRRNEVRIGRIEIELQRLANNINQPSTTTDNSRIYFQELEGLIRGMQNTSIGTRPPSRRIIKSPFFVYKPVSYHEKTLDSNTQLDAQTRPTDQIIDGINYSALERIYGDRANEKFREIREYNSKATADRLEADRRIAQEMENRRNSSQSDRNIQPTERVQPDSQIASETSAYWMRILSLEKDFPRDSNETEAEYNLKIKNKREAIEKEERDNLGVDRRSQKDRRDRVNYKW